MDIRWTETKVLPPHIARVADVEGIGRLLVKRSSNKLHYYDGFLNGMILVYSQDSMKQAMYELGREMKKRYQRFNIKDVLWQDVPEHLMKF